MTFDMCGIAGIFDHLGRIGPDDISAVEIMNAGQVHRGPDGAGLDHDDFVVLGHRRLAIIDLSGAGRQPMTNEDATVWVTYNGEIYNYRELHADLKSHGHVFGSHSDTEILVHGYEQWGIDGLLNRVRGMFAFALYDSCKRSCILARDRLGIKPLYYFEPAGGNRLAFASEVKSLIRAGLVPNDRDREAIAGFLLLGSVPAPLTSTQGVRCLMPGHYLTTEAGGVRLRKYWDLDFHPAPRLDEAEAALQRSLEDAVPHHLISDVPVGIFLSGGMDSCGLVALASRSHTRLSTLTVVFDEQEFSEAASARQVAKHFGTQHFEVRVTGEDFMREFPNLLSAMDQPTNDGVNTYFVSQAARRTGLTVVLSGLGGDEVFWGYQHHRFLVRQQRYLSWFSQLPPRLRWPIVAGAGVYGWALGQERWLRLQSMKRSVGNVEVYLALRGFFAPSQVARLMDLREPELQAIIDRHFASIRPAGVNCVPSVEGVNQIETKRYLHDQLLRDTDVFSMAHSIEVRVPYLDHKVVEYATRLPGTYKANGGARNKPALANAINNPFLSNLAKRHKRGFCFPLGKWMGVYASQLAAVAQESKVLDPATVRSMWQAFRQGRLHWSRAWALTVMGGESGSGTANLAGKCQSVPST